MRSAHSKRRQVALGLRVLAAAEPNLPTIEAEKVRAIVQAEADKPLRGQARDMQHDGIFGDAHRQQRLFD
jgi:hypothetical protein